MQIIKEENGQLYYLHSITQYIGAKSYNWSTRIEDAREFDDSVIADVRSVCPEARWA